MFKEYYGATIKQTFQVWTVMECIVGTVGLIGTLLLNSVVGPGPAKPSAQAVPAPQHLSGKLRRDGASSHDALGPASVAARALTLRGAGHWQHAGGCSAVSYGETDGLSGCKRLPWGLPPAAFRPRSQTCRPSM